jgi:hypothetical protein
MTGMRRAALAAIALLVAAASLTSFAESYRALLDWASRHGLHGGWALAWPLQVDTFIAVGELALFVALADRWAARSRAAAWAVTLAGLAVSVAGNVGHVTSHDWARQATAAVPPLAAAAALAVGLGVLKRVVAARPAGPGGHSPDLSADRPESLPWAPAQTALQTGPRTGLEAGTDTEERSGPEGISGPVRMALPGPVPDSPAGPARKPAANRPGRRTPNRSAKRATTEDAEQEFAAEIAAGHVPSIYQIRSRLHVGNDRAKVLRQHIARQALAT